MARKCRVLQTGQCEITQWYSDKHRGVDLVGANYTLANIVAHSDGVVVSYRNNCTGFEGNGSYGNYVKLKHDDGYYTLYAHMKYGTVNVKVGQKIKKSEYLGGMGATGEAYGAHLHFEVRNQYDTKIDPIPYLDADLPEVSQQVNVYYRVKTRENGWLDEVKNLDDYAGLGKNSIIDFMVKVDKGSVWYQAHVKGKGWLSKVTGYNMNDYYNGYAGDDKNPIDCVRIYYNTPQEIVKTSGYKQAKYRINNLPWQIDDETSKGQDGYAGNMGQDAYKLEIIIK